MRQTLSAFALLLFGCTANISGKDGQNPSAPGSPEGSAGSMSGAGGAGPTTGTCTTTQATKPDISARVRRLTRLELENSLADLLGDGTRPLARDLEADTFAIGYSTGDERGVSSNYVDALKSVAERASAGLPQAADYVALGTNCKQDEASAKGCAQTFIKAFAARALRRSAAQAELDGLFTVYQAGRATVPTGDQAAALSAGLQHVTRALLQSSSFIFRTELGDESAPGAQPDRVALTPYETAAAISFALTASPPDAALTEKAASGSLTTTEQLSAEAHRLLAAYPDRFARQAERFVREWLSIDVASPAWSKDAKLYPEASPAFKAALDQETQLFLRDWAKSGSFTELLSRPRGFVSKANAAAYGLTVTSTELLPTELDAKQRAGILTLPSYLGSRAHTDSSSPVLRGVAIMKKFLCLEPPPVPAMVPPLPAADKSGAKTTRERFEAHTSIAFCSTCHKTFDPMGNAFEHYDAIGRYREQENGEPIDSSGALVGSSADAPVADAVELSKLLSTSPDVHACFVRQAYRFTVGRHETDANACALTSYTKVFSDNNLDLRELMLSLVTTPESFQRVPLTPDP